MLIELYEDKELLWISREVISIELLLHLFLSLLLFARSGGALFGFSLALLDRDAFKEESVVEDWADLGFLFHLRFYLAISHLFFTN